MTSLENRVSEFFDAAKASEPTEPPLLLVGDLMAEIRRLHTSAHRVVRCSWCCSGSVVHRVGERCTARVTGGERCHGFYRTP